MCEWLKKLKKKFVLRMQLAALHKHLDDLNKKMLLQDEKLQNVDEYDLEANVCLLEAKRGLLKERFCVLAATAQTLDEKIQLAGNVDEIKPLLNEKNIVIYELRETFAEMLPVMEKMVFFMRKVIGEWNSQH